MMKTHRLLPAALIALAFVGSALAADEPAKVVTIQPEALHARLQSAEKPFLVDVREPAEFEAGHIEGALLAPLGTVEENLKDIARNREILLICRSGHRSGLAYQRLAGRGYTNLKNVEGGMLAWEKLGYPVVRK